LLERRVVSQNFRSAAAQVIAELNIHLDPVTTKTVQCELQKYNIHDRAEIAKPLITEKNTQMHK
jgi:hypothetical protein